MDEINEKPAYYAIIPASVRYDKSLPQGAKLLYAEISSLCNATGLCWAKNTYFEKLYDVSKRTIQNWLEALYMGNHIYRNVQFDTDGKTVLQRCISIVPVENFLAPTPASDFTGCKNFHEGGAKNCTPLVQKTALSNNKLKYINYINTSTRVRAREDFEKVFALVTPYDQLPGELTDIEKANLLWMRVMDALQMQVNSLGFDVWLKMLSPKGFIGQALVLQAETESACEEISNRYAPLITKLIEQYS